MSETAHMYFHRGFRPNISELLSKDDLITMANWQMATSGEPIPTFHRAKAAIWYGQSEDLAEIPVVSVLTPEDVLSTQAWWLIGIAKRSEFIESTDHQRYLAEAAQFLSPNSVYAAIAGLRQLLGDKEAIFNDTPNE